MEGEKVRIKRTRLGKGEKCTILNALQMQIEIQNDGGDRGEATRAQNLIDKLLEAPDWK